MKIERAISHGQSTAMDGPEVRWATPSPVVQPHREDQYASQDATPRRPGLLRGTLSSLRLQNLPVARANMSPPGPNSTDRQLVEELEKNFGELHAFLKEGRLTQSSLRLIAEQTLKGD